MMTANSFAQGALGCVAAMLAAAGPVAAAPLHDHDRPLAFVENQGQTDARVRFYAQGQRAMFHVTSDEVRVSLLQHLGPSHTRGVVLGLQFLGSNPDVAIEGSRRTTGVFNYLHGNDPAGWHTSVPSYGESSGALYIAGKTMSSDFPTTVGAFDRIFNGNTSIFWGDAFIAKLTLP